MPIFRLTDHIFFPNPKLAEKGILAIGGDLSPMRLLMAYKNGIFPWYNEGEPIIWHAPDPRFVLFPKKFKRSKTLQKLIKDDIYLCTINENFSGVIKNCSNIYRKDQEGTWITNDMIEAYIEMHQLGYAYSVEVINYKKELVGGLYGLKLGQVFFGESMFSKEDNTSKIALSYLIDNLDVKLIDAQVYTKHFESLGGEHITLDEFLFFLQEFIPISNDLDIHGENDLKIDL